MDLHELQREAADEEDGDKEVKRTRAKPEPAELLHYGDLRARATTWWALQRVRIRLTQAVGAAKKAGWGTKDDHLSVALAGLVKQERAAARATVQACASVYPAIAQLIAETEGIGPAVALYLGLIPPLMRLEDFPGFPCPAALWAYSGLSAERRQKCDRRARMIAIMYIATPAVIRGPAFHTLYAARRVATVPREWQKAHAHRDAVRYVAKRILRILWLCRLPGANPHDALLTVNALPAAGAPLSVVHPLDTRALLENPHEGGALAPESDLLPLDGLLTTRGLSTPEPEGNPMELLATKHEVSAPELDPPTLKRLRPRDPLSAPESDGPPIHSVSPVPRLSAPESAGHPDQILASEDVIAAPEPDESPVQLLRTDDEVSAPGAAA